MPLETSMLASCAARASALGAPAGVHAAAARFGGSRTGGNGGGPASRLGGTGRGERPGRSSESKYERWVAGASAGGGCWTATAARRKAGAGSPRGRRRSSGARVAGAPRAPRAAGERERGWMRCAARARRERRGGRVAGRGGGAGPGGRGLAEQRAARATRGRPGGRRSAHARARAGERRNGGRVAGGRAAREEQEPSAPRARGVSRGQAARARARERGGRSSARPWTADLSDLDD